MFSLLFGNARQAMGSAPYCGDSETGLVHCRDADCSAEASEPFLDVRTALVRGYSLCPCCIVEHSTGRRAQRVLQPQQPY